MGPDGVFCVHRPIKKRTDNREKWSEGQTLLEIYRIHF